MLKNMYSIYDKKAAFYLTPFFMRNDAEAQRVVQQSLMHEPQSPVSTTPEDYQLCRIGSFDDTTGELFYEQVEIIAECAALRVQAGPLDPDAPLGDS